MPAKIRRTGTFLSARLCGYPTHNSTNPSHDLDELLQQYLLLLAGSVAQHEGVLIETRMDGLAAFFSAQLRPRDHIMLALQAAIDMQNKLTRFIQDARRMFGFSLGLCVGVHQGSVNLLETGQEGDPVRKWQIPLHSRTVLRAGQLAALAQPGTILASHAVYYRTLDLVEYQPPGWLSPSSKSSIPSCSQVIEFKQKPGNGRGIEGLWAPMIGRELELQRLQEAFIHTLQDQRGQFALVTGEAGIGKTRLLKELQSLFGPSEFHLLQGQARSHPNSKPYGLFISLLSWYSESFSADKKRGDVNTPRQGFVNKTRLALGSHAAEVLPYLEHLLSLAPSDLAASRRIHFLDSEQLRQQIFLAIRDLLIAEAGQQPLVLILEDLHWADEASIELLKLLLVPLQKYPILMIAVSRTFQEGSIASLLDEARQHYAERYHLLELQTLSIHQSEQLLSQLLAIPDFPSNIQEQILKRSAGVPFYLEEILRMLIDGGVLHQEKRGWRLSPKARQVSLGVPTTLQELILSRYEQLDRLQKRILGMASVIGHQFPLPLLQAVLQEDGPHPHEDVFARLVSFSLLIDRQYIVATLGPSQADYDFTQDHDFPPDYAFKHVLVRDAIYQALPEYERCVIHGRVGRAIEHLYEDRLEDKIELLAYHYTQSLYPDRAFYFSILAGQKAARGFANQQARKYFEQAVTLLPGVAHTTDQVIQARTGLGDTLVLMGEYPQAREQYEDALLLSIENPALHRKIGITHERQGNYAQALQSLEDARRTIEALTQPDLIEQAQISSETGWVHFRRGALDDAEKFLIQAGLLVEGTHQYDVIASIYNRLGGVSYQKEDLEQAVSYTHRALALRQEIGDVIGVARTFNNLGLICWKQGFWDEAITHFNNSFTMHENLDDVEGQVDLHGNLGLLYLDRGNIKKAKHHFLQSLRMAEGIGLTYMVGRSYLYFCRLHLAMRKWQPALDAGHRSLDILEQLGAEDDSIFACAYLGMAELELGNLNEAEAWGLRALGIARHLKEYGKLPEQSEERAIIIRLLGQVYLQRGDSIQASKYLEESAGIFLAKANQLEKARTDIIQARLASMCGEESRAYDLRNGARSIFEQLGARLDLQNIDL